LLPSAISDDPADLHPTGTKIWLNCYARPDAPASPRSGVEPLRRLRLGWPRREAMCMARRARFDAQTTLEEFDFTAGPTLLAAAIRHLAALRWLHAGQSVILDRPVGVGKAMSRKDSATSPSAMAPTCGSPNQRPWLTSPAATPTRTWPQRLAELARPHRSPRTHHRARSQPHFPSGTAC